MSCKIILMTEEQWANSQISIVMRYGSCCINGEFFVIVDKRGKYIFECSLEAERQGRDKAIEPGEPCDLVCCDYVPVYRKLGREGFLAWLRDESADHSLDAAYKFAGLKQRKSKKVKE